MVWDPAQLGHVHIVMLRVLYIGDKIAGNSMVDLSLNIVSVYSP